MKGEPAKVSYADISDPKATDSERSKDDSEYLELEGVGSCFNCARTHPSKLAEMKSLGQLEGNDPWGAMRTPLPAAAGSSKQTRPQEARALEDIAASPGPKAESIGIPLDEIDEMDDEYAPKQYQGKGKGRLGEPAKIETILSSASRDVHEPDSSDDEDEAHASEQEGYPRGRPAMKKSESSRESSTESIGRKSRSPTSEAHSIDSKNCSPIKTSTSGRRSRQVHTDDEEEELMHRKTAHGVSESESDDEDGIRRL